MKNKIPLFLLLFFLILDGGLLYYYLNLGQKNISSAPQIESQKLNEFLPNVTIKKFSFDKQAARQRKITGQLTIQNNENVSLSHLTLTMELEQGLTNNTLYLIHRYLYPEQISLAPKTSQEISFTYNLPESLNSDGLYFITPIILNQTGITIAQASETLKEIVGENRMLEIDWRRSKIIHDEQEKTPLEGPIFAPKEEPTIKLVVKNRQLIPIKAAPRFLIYPRAHLAGVKPIADYQEDVIQFEPESEQILIFRLPSYKEPESYLADLTFIDQEKRQLSGIAEFRWVIGGPGGKILAVKIDPVEDFLAKMKSNMTVSLIGPADGLTVNNVTLQGKIFSDDDKKMLLETFSQTLHLNAQPKNIVFPITFSSQLLKSPKVRVQTLLMNQDQGQALDTTEESMLLLIDSSKQQKLLYASGGLTFVILLITLSLILFRKKKIPPGSCQGLFLILLVSQFVFSLLLAAPNSLAGTLSGPPDSGTGECTKSSDPKCANENNKPTYQFTVSLSHEAILNEEGSILASGSVEVVMCSNGVVAYTIPEMKSISIDWGDYFMGAKSFRRFGTPRQVGKLSVEIQQYALASTPLCWSCTGATFTRTLYVTVKEPYYYCNDSIGVCEFVNHYKNVTECENANPGKDCYNDISTCTAWCESPILPTPVQPSPDPLQTEPPPRAVLTCIDDPDNSDPKVKMCGTVLVPFNQPDPLLCNQNTDCYKPVPTPPPQSNPPPKGQPGQLYNVCKTYTDALGTRFACEVSDSPGLACVPGGPTCAGDWTDWSPDGACGRVTESRSCQCGGPCCGLAPKAATCAGDQDGPAAHCGDPAQTRQACFSQAPQAVPNITTITQSDGGTVIQTRDIKINWQFNEGTPGCGEPWGSARNGLPDCQQVNNNQFKVKLFDSAGQKIFDSPDAAIPSRGGNGLTNYTYTTTTNPLKANADYSVQVCASNGLLESCSSKKAITKTRMTKGQIVGKLWEYDETLAGADKCQGPGINLPSGKKIDLTIRTSSGQTLAKPSWISLQCNTTAKANAAESAAQYTCDVGINNTDYDVNADPDDSDYQSLFADLNFSFNLKLPDNPHYQTDKYYCKQTDAGLTLSCPGNLTSEKLCADFPQNRALPLPQPLTPMAFDKNKGGTDKITYHNVLADVGASQATYSYYKLAQASYVDLDGIQSLFPANPQPYDADDTSEPYLVIAQTGSQATVGTSTGNGPLNLGSGLGVSQKNWGDDNYAKKFYLTSAGFKDYIISRKTYKDLTPLITGDDKLPPGNPFSDKQIHLVNKSITLVQDDIAKFQSKRIILVVNGVLTVAPQSGKFNPNEADPGNTATMIIANSLVFDPDLTEANAVFIGGTVDLGTSTKPLKVKGNLISSAAIATNPNLSRKRHQETLKPSLFVVADAKPYLELLPLLSVSDYRWSELVP